MNRSECINRDVKDLRNRAEGYLTKLDERLGPFIPRAILSLPLYLRERFSVFSVRVFGRNWLLAIEEDGWDTGTPTEYRQHWQQLKKATGEEHVAIVLPSLSATVRNRMIGQGVPFLIPDIPAGVYHTAEGEFRNLGVRLRQAALPASSGVAADASAARRAGRTFREGAVRKVGILQGFDVECDIRAGTEQSLRDLSRG